MSEMSAAERKQLIDLNRKKARQAEREAAMREKVLLAEVQDELTAEFDAHDRLWSEAVAIAAEAVAKANAHIRAQCMALGIAAKDAPQVELGWSARREEYASPRRRAELRKRAETQLAARTQIAKAEANRAALNVEEQLVMGGLQSSEARDILAALPTVDQLLTPLSLEDLGVTRWHPPASAAKQLLTPLSATDRKRRAIILAIQSDPDASDRAIAVIADCDHKTVAKYRPEAGGEFPAITGELDRHGDES